MHSGKPHRKGSVMASVAQRSRTGPQTLFTLILFGILMALVYVGAAAEQQQETDKAAYPAETGPAVESNLHYQLTVFTIGVSIVLLTPALGFFILRRSAAGDRYWLAFWTFSYVAYL